MNHQSQDRAGSRATRLIVLVAIGAAFMAALDLFAVNVAFDDIGRDFGVGTPGGPTPADLSWILTAYAVVYAAGLVPFGRLADRYGIRRTFIAGLLVFTLSSAGCAASGDVWTLVGLRALQAAGASAMTPSSVGLLTASLPAEQRAGAVRLWAATGSLAAAIGPTVGGLLAQVSWHWVFLVNLPVGLALVVGALRVIPGTARRGDALRPDLVGAAAVAIGVALFALALSRSDDWGWTSGWTWAVLGGSALTLAFFGWQSSRHPAPVIAPELFALPSFRDGNLAMLTFNAAFAASLLAGVLWMEQIWGYDVVRTGLALAPGPLVGFASTFLVPRLVPGWSAGARVFVGALLGAVALALLAGSMGPEPGYLSDFLPGWVLLGLAVGFVLPSLFAGAAHELATEHAATGSGVINMARQIGYVIGFSGLFAFIGADQGIAAVDGLRRALAAAAVTMLVAAAVGLSLALRSRASRPASVAEVVA